MLRSASGIRTEKKYGNNTTRYYVEGDRILAENSSDGLLTYEYGLGGLERIRLTAGSSSVYDVIRDSSGNITKLYKRSQSGSTLAAEYTYDAYGVCTTKAYDDKGAGAIAGWAAVGVGALSLGIGAAAGIGSYALEYGVHSDKSLSGRGFALAGLNGALQAGVTFGAGVIGGKLGLFNKLTHANPLDYYIQQITTNGSLTAMQSVGYGLTVLGGQSFARFALVGAAAAGSRFLINTIAGWFY